MSTDSPTPADWARADLRALAADCGLGGLVNAIDEIGTQHGSAVPPESAKAFACHLHPVLKRLDLNYSKADRASYVWRDSHNQAGAMGARLGLTPLGRARLTSRQLGLISPGS
jgi:hypothetical protein